MDNDELMTIGRFARLTGLPISTLRHYDEVRRTEHSDYSAFMFGTYGQDNFFPMHLIAGQDLEDLTCPSTFGLLVEYLDACHARAITAGAAETVAPHEAEVMPMFCRAIIRA